MIFRGYIKEFKCYDKLKFYENLNFIIIYIFEHDTHSSRSLMLKFSKRDFSTF